MRHGPELEDAMTGRQIKLVFVGVLIEYQFQDNRRRDPDNYSGKFILDGLTKGGIIRDDSFQHISLTVRAKPTPGPAETTITIREVLNDERPEIR